MKKRFEITKAGKARVESSEFAEEIRRFIREKRADESCTQEMGFALITFRIATALAGLEDPNPFSTSEEASEFVKVIDEHIAEINAAAERGLEQLMLSDVENLPMN